MNGKLELDFNYLNRAVNSETMLSCTSPTRMLRALNHALEGPGTCC